MEWMSTPACTDSATHYQQTIRRIPLLSQKEEQYLAHQVRAGCSRCRDIMVTRNLRLVMNMARRFEHRGMPLMDLVSEGNIGLLRAVEKFEPERGFRFSTYATWWVRQAIERCIMNQARTVRLPIHVLKDIGQCLASEQELQKRLQRPVRQSEVSAHSGRSPRQLDRLLHWHESSRGHSPGTMNEVGDTGGGSEQGAGAVQEPEPAYADGTTMLDPARLLKDEKLREHINAWIGALSQKQRDVIIRRFGFHQHECRTLEEVGRHIGLTRERVRQIQIEALEILREKAEAEELDTSVF